MVINFTPSSATWHKKQEYIYGLGVGISTVFEIFGHFVFKEGTGPTCMVMTYIHCTFWCSLTQGTRIYTVLGWRIQQFWTLKI
jgi:hypothetical protein